MKKNIKISKKFKGFIDSAEGETYQDKILNLMKLNNPKAYKEFKKWKNSNGTNGRKKS